MDPGGSGGHDDDISQRPRQIEQDAGGEGISTRALHHLSQGRLVCQLFGSLHHQATVSVFQKMRVCGSEVRAVCFALAGSALNRPICGSNASRPAPLQTSPLFSLSFSVIF